MVDIDYEGGFEMSNAKGASKGRFANRRAKTTLGLYEEAVNEYKKLVADKTHPENRTAAYKKNTMSTFNRLLTAADNLDNEDPGAGIFGLITLSLITSLAIKDKNIELAVEVRNLEKRIKRLEKR